MCFFLKFLFFPSTVFITSFIVWMSATSRVHCPFYQKPKSRHNGSFMWISATHTDVETFFNLSPSSLVCTFRLFGSDPKYFETISANEREVDGGGEVYRLLNENHRSIETWAPLLGYLLLLLALISGITWIAHVLRIFCFHSIKPSMMKIRASTLKCKSTLVFFISLEKLTMFFVIFQIHSLP